MPYSTSGPGASLVRSRRDSGSLFQTTCFVAEHIAGTRHHTTVLVFYDRYVQKASDLNDAVVLVPHEGWDHMDFKAPDCSGT